MKVGDLVLIASNERKNGLCSREKSPFLSFLARRLYGRFGLVLEWYDTPKGMVTVGWWHEGNYWTNPIHVSKLEVISESR